MSSSVCWDVLEKQLFRCKLGQDERRRALFDSVAQQDTSPGPHVKLKRGGGEREKVSVSRGEAVRMMQQILDASTHLKNFPTPSSTELAVFLAAKEDHYVPRANITDVRQLWQGGDRNILLLLLNPPPSLFFSLRV